MRIIFLFCRKLNKLPAIRSGWIVMRKHSDELIFYTVRNIPLSAFCRDLNLTNNRCRKKADIDNEVTLGKRDFIRIGIKSALHSSVLLDRTTYCAPNGRLMADDTNSHKMPPCDIVPNRSLPIFYPIPIILSSPQNKINHIKDVSQKEFLQIIDDHLNFPDGKFVNRMVY